MRPDVGSKPLLFSSGGGSWRRGGGIMQAAAAPPPEQDVLEGCAALGGVSSLRSPGRAIAGAGGGLPGVLQRRFCAGKDGSQMGHFRAL